jgi:hypothetical protein
VRLLHPCRLGQIGGNHLGQRGAIEHHRLAIHGHHLRLIAVRLADRLEVFPYVERDQADAFGVLGDGRQRQALALQFLALVVGQIDKPAVEQDVDLGLIDRPVGFPALVKDRHRRPSRTASSIPYLSR